MERPIKYITHSVLPSDTGLFSSFIMTAKVRSKEVVFDIEDFITDEAIEKNDSAYLVDSYARCRSAVLTIAEAMEC